MPELWLSWVSSEKNFILLLKNGTHQKMAYLLSTNLARLGEWGPYQFKQHLLHLFTSFLAGIHMLSLSFTAPEPDHRYVKDMFLVHPLKFVNSFAQVIHTVILFDHHIYHN